MSQTLELDRIDILNLWQKNENSEKTNNLFENWNSHKKNSFDHELQSVNLCASWLKNTSTDIINSANIFKRWSNQTSTVDETPKNIFKLWSNTTSEIIESPRNIFSLWDVQKSSQIEKSSNIFSNWITQKTSTIDQRKNIFSMWNTEQSISPSKNIFSLWQESKADEKLFSHNLFSSWSELIQKATEDKKNLFVSWSKEQNIIPSLNLFSLWKSSHEISPLINLLSSWAQKGTFTPHNSGHHSLNTIHSRETSIYGVKSKILIDPIDDLRHPHEEAVVTIRNSINHLTSVKDEVSFHKNIYYPMPIIEEIPNNQYYEIIKFKNNIMTCDHIIILGDTNSLIDVDFFIEKIKEKISPYKKKKNIPVHFFLGLDNLHFQNNFHRNYYSVKKSLKTHLDVDLKILYQSELLATIENSSNVFLFNFNFAHSYYDSWLYHEILNKNGHILHLREDEAHENDLKISLYHGIRLHRKVDK